MNQSQTPHRLVAVNIGNTNLSFALFEGREMLWSRWMPVEQADRAGEVIARQKEVTDIVVASVNPACTRRVSAAYRRVLHRGIMTIGKEVPVPIIVLTDEPERVGADRLLNALAAYSRCKPRSNELERGKGPAVVVDVGTAITFDIVSRRGEFLGGLIAPGMRISALALGQYTALLPKVTIKRPHGLFGKNTEEAIRSGIYWGAVGMISGVTALLRKRLGENTSLFLTGGGAPFLASHLPREITYVPHLTLEGILHAYEACIPR